MKGRLRPVNALACRRATETNPQSGGATWGIEIFFIHRGNGMWADFTSLPHIAPVFGPKRGSRSSLHSKMCLNESSLEARKSQKRYVDYWNKVWTVELKVTKWPTITISAVPCKIMHNESDITWMGPTTHEVHIHALRGRRTWLSVSVHCTILLKHLN